jgi:hypothetical protein
MLHVCYMILLSFLELTSYKIAVADLLLSWQSHRKQRAVSSVHCIPEVSQLRVFEEALRWDFACGESDRSAEERTHARRHRWSALRQILRPRTEVHDARCCSNMLSTSCVRKRCMRCGLSRRPVLHACLGLSRVSHFDTRHSSGACLGFSRVSSFWFF